MNIKQFVTVMLLSTSMLATGLSSQSALADSHGHHDGHHDGHHEGIMEDSHGDGHESMEHSPAMHEAGRSGAAVQAVMGHGVVNKVMPEANMINITHEPMQALDWPKMKMNFKVDKAVDLSVLQPGQQVEFMLQVMEGNNYLVKEVQPK